MKLITKDLTKFSGVEVGRPFVIADSMLIPQLDDYFLVPPQFSMLVKIDEKTAVSLREWTAWDGYIRKIKADERVIVFPSEIGLLVDLKTLLERKVP